MALAFNHWHRQAYVLQGQVFPSPASDWLLAIEPSEVVWQWWNECNRLSFAKLAQVSIGNPPGDQS
jgi:hypothetical protein